ncbi:tyrosine-type recombinase/integrase [Vibrio aestuarianus]|uniref:tyrosine-type recombinase/integrase n=1 Tax=Vibrio aestuarianus TaxID=28171 RepID=UPI001594CB7D|nr:tyrosine-type recombinase/integrase [Vibrio aestuarianus]MDE1233935.1 tyrosine-type recombinase/integrase [Vibrio aestuarianus]MDE1244812.1 tyrosine-type recombinase/integrase [Vibrio aestuarianus]NGZ62052.1 tyrosine-type recombinase/integrase [Vibrio aestuarianus subsp. cardii]
MLNNPEKLNLKDSLEALKVFGLNVEKDLTLLSSVSIRGKLGEPNTLMLNLTRLSKKLGVVLSKKTFNSDKGIDVNNKIISMMLDNGFIIDGYNGTENEVYRRLRAWEYSLTEEEFSSLATGHSFINWPKDIKNTLNWGLKGSDLREVFRSGIKKRLREKNLYPASITINTVDNFIYKIKETPALLWQVSLSTNSPCTISKSSFVNTLSGKSNEFDNFIKYWNGTLHSLESPNRKAFEYFEENVYPLMVEKGVVDENLSRPDNIFRMSVMNWWYSLSDEEKKNVTTRGNTVILPYHAKHNSKLVSLELIESIRAEINKELVELGILLPNNEYTKSKDIERNTSYRQEAAERKDFFVELRESDPEVVGWVDSEACYDINYPQLFHLFALASLSSVSESGFNNYKTGYSHFATYLKEIDIPDSSNLIYMAEFFGHNIAKDFKINYLMPRIDATELAPKTANSILISVNGALSKLKEYKEFKFDFYSAFCFEDTKVGDTHRPFQNIESDALKEAIASEYDDIMNRVHTGYVPLDRTSDEFKKNKSSLENKLRIYFEDVLHCEMFFQTKIDNKTKESITFQSRVNKYNFSIHDLYKGWGLIPIINIDVIMPFVMRICEVTGINIDSICELEFDDLIDKHPLTQKSCLTFWKERSTGGKEYHLDIFKADLQWLSKSQSQVITNVFRDVKLLTAPIRHLLPEEHKNKLFVYLNNTRDRATPIIIFKHKGRFGNRFVEKYDIKDAEGNPTFLQMTRFRPTFASKLVEMGVSLREIQFAMGHKSLSTTVKYLDKLDLNEKIRKQAYQAIKNLHDNAVQSEVKSKRSSKYRFNSDEIIMSTPLAGCKNVFDPPDFIRKSKLFVVGQPCSQYNKCLSCSNIMLSRIHLPVLFAMQRDYLLLLQGNAIQKTPYFVVVSENLSLLHDILDPEFSEFCEEELRQAKEDSIFIETAVIDNFGG